MGLTAVQAEISNVLIAVDGFVKPLILIVQEYAEIKPFEFALISVLQHHASNLNVNRYFTTTPLLDQSDHDISSPLVARWPVYMSPLKWSVCIRPVPSSIMAGFTDGRAQREWSYLPEAEMHAALRRCTPDTLFMHYLHPPYMVHNQCVIHFELSLAEMIVFMTVQYSDNTFARASHQLKQNPYTRHFFLCLQRGQTATILP